MSSTGSGRKQQRWSVISTSTSNNNHSIRLAGNAVSSSKRYSMSSLTQSSLSVDTLNSEEAVSSSAPNKTHRKTASVEESLVNINIERFSTGSNNNTSSGGSGMTAGSSDFMFTNITEDTGVSVSNSIRTDKTKKRYSGYLNDYVRDFNTATGNTGSSMTPSRSISSLSSIIASAGNTYNPSSRRVPAASSSMSLKRESMIPNSHSNASLSSHISTSSQSSKSSKWMFWRRKSMMNLAEYAKDSDAGAVNTGSSYSRGLMTTMHASSNPSTKPGVVSGSYLEVSEPHTLPAKSSIDSLKSKIKMKLFQEPQSLDIEKPHIYNAISDSPKSNMSSSPMGRVPKRSSFISLKRSSKSNLRTKSSQQSFLRTKNSKDSLATMTTNGNFNSSAIKKGSGTPTEEMMNHSFENDANYGKHSNFDTPNAHAANYKQQHIFSAYDDEEDEERDVEKYSMMDNFIKLCYKADNISRVFQRINNKDIYYQRDTTVVTRGNNNSSNYYLHKGAKTICKYLAFDSLDNHRIELILKEIEITKKMTSLLREKLIEQTGNEDISLKQISDTYGISPILNMTLISNIFPEDYSKKNFHIMINNLYEMRKNESYSCILKLEYFDLGIPLSVFLQSSPKPSSRVISKIFIKILHLLSKLEAIGFQHQDLNLDNIIVSSSYNVYIIDYKVCKFQQEIDTRLDYPLFYKRDSPHYEVYLEMRKVIPYIQKTGDNFGWCHIIWIKYILSKMLESINNNRDKHYDTLMNWLKFILKHQADLENCRDLISYQKKKK